MFTSFGVIYIAKEIEKLIRHSKVLSLKLCNSEF